jgi:hypothetical protein
MEDNLQNILIPINEIVKKFKEYIKRSRVAKSKEILNISSLTLLTDME